MYGLTLSGVLVSKLGRKQKKKWKQDVSCSITNTTVQLSTSSVCIYCLFHTQTHTHITYLPFLSHTL